MAEKDSQQWNVFLNNCLKTSNLKVLQETLYGIQQGMDDLAKKKMNTAKMQLLFIRWQRSLEQTAKKILRKKYPSPLDNSVFALKIRSKEKNEYQKYILIKRKRDSEFEKWCRGVSF